MLECNWEEFEQLYKVRVTKCPEGKVLGYGKTPSEAWKRAADTLFRWHYPETHSAPRTFTMKLEGPPCSGKSTFMTFLLNHVKGIEFLQVDNVNHYMKINMRMERRLPADLPVIRCE